MLAWIGTVGDALDNALAESFVDSYKTELIADRVWRSRSQLELATVEWVAWFNHQRLHEAHGDISPVEYEQLHGSEVTLDSPISGNRSLTSTRPRAAAGLRERRGQALGVDFAVDPQIRPPTLQSSERYPLRPRHKQVDDESAPCGLSDE